MASFDENGKYIKTNWKAGDKITATKLNKIEESIEAVNDNDISRHVEADARLDALEAKDVAHDKELTNIKNAIADNKAAAELGDYDINSRMTFLENELNEGIEEVHNVAETVDGKIATAEADMTAQVNTATANMTAQVDTAKDEMTTQVNTATANMTAQVNAATANMTAQVNEATANMTAQVDTAKDEMTAQVDTAKDEMTAQVNAAKNEMTAMVADMTAQVNAAKNEMTAQVDTATANMTAQVDTATANMTAQVNAAKDEMATQVNTATANMTAQVNTATADMTAQVDTAKDEMAAMVAMVAGVAAEFRESINKIGQLEVRIQELETEISKLVPTVGTVNEDNTITITYDMLGPGTYTLKYDFEDDTQEELEEFTVGVESNKINLMEEAEIRINSRYSNSGGGYIYKNGVICFTIPFINDSGNAMRLEFDNLTYSMLDNDCILYILDNDKSNPREVNGNTVINKMDSGVELADDRLSGTITFTPSINEGYITISLRTKNDGTSTTEDEIKDYIATLTMEVTN